jgi:hypothetical protein
MNFSFPVKVWCSKGDVSTSSDSQQSFYLYSRVEGEEGTATGVSELIEGTVEAVASQYFGTGVVFDRCVMQSLDDNAFYKWKITEVPLPGKAISPEDMIKQNQIHQALTYGLSPQQLDKLFPFHIVFDSSLNIVQSGELCIRLVSTAVVGAKVTEMFDIFSEDSQYSLQWEEVRSKLKGEGGPLNDVLIDFCLATTLHRTPLGHTIGLIGQLSFSLTDKVAVFLCCPDVSSLERMVDLGVVMQNLSKSDRLQLQKDALSDTLHGMKIMKADRAEFAVTQLKQALISVQDKLVTKQSYVRYVSHEIRTPLMVVDIGLLLLGEDLKDVHRLLGEQRTSSYIETQSSKTSVGVGRSESGVVTNDATADAENIIKNSLETVADCSNSMRVAIGILSDLLAYEKIESGVFQLDKTTVLASLFFMTTINEFKLQVFW